MTAIETLRPALDLPRIQALSAADMAAGWSAHFVDEIDVRRVDAGHEDLLTTSGVPAWSPWWANHLHQTPGED